MVFSVFELFHLTREFLTHMERTSLPDFQIWPLFGTLCHRAVNSSEPRVMWHGSSVYKYMVTSEDSLYSHLQPNVWHCFNDFGRIEPTSPACEVNALPTEPPRRLKVRGRFPKSLHEKLMEDMEGFSVQILSLNEPC